MRLQGKTALVTGAGRGIGRATALALAKAGAKVIAVAPTQADLDDLAREGGGRIEAWAADVRDAAWNSPRAASGSSRSRRPS